MLSLVFSDCVRDVPFYDDIMRGRETMTQFCRAQTNYHNLKLRFLSLSSVELNVFFMSLLHICRHFSNYFPLWICQFVSSSIQKEYEYYEKKKARAHRTNNKQQKKHIFFELPFVEKDCEEWEIDTHRTYANM